LLLPAVDVTLPLALPLVLRERECGEAALQHTQHGSAVTLAQEELDQRRVAFRGVAAVHYERPAKRGVAHRLERQHANRPAAVLRVLDDLELTLRPVPVPGRVAVGDPPAGLRHKLPDPLQRRLDGNLALDPVLRLHARL